MKFWRWMFLSSLSYAICAAMLFAVAGLAMRVAFRKLWLPYALFLACWVICGPLIYWVTRADNSRNTYAARLASVMFLYAVLAFSTAVLGVAIVGIIPKTKVINDFPLVLLVSALFSFGAYKRALRVANPLT